MLYNNKNRISRVIVSIICLFVLTGCGSSGSEIEKQEDKEEVKVESMYRLLKETRNVLIHQNSDETIEYSYDENGNCIREKNYSYEQQQYVFESESDYDENNNVIHMKSYSNGELTQISTYEYQEVKKSS